MTIRAQSEIEEIRFFTVPTLRGEYRCRYNVKLQKYVVELVRRMDKKIVFEGNRQACYRYLQNI